MPSIVIVGLFTLIVPVALAHGASFDHLVYDHCGPPYRSDSAFGPPWGAHEAPLHGVPLHYDWAKGARPGYWLNFGSHQAVTSWGQIYEAASESPVTDLRVQIRNHTLHAFSGGRWILLESGPSAQAAFWSEDFTTSYGASAARDESANGGGVSFPVLEDRTLHWWLPRWPRAALPADTAALLVSCELRLIHGTDATANLSAARYLAGVSADHYPTPTSVTRRDNRGSFGRDILWGLG